jgi:hypothetical protein
MTRLNHWESSYFPMSVSCISLVLCLGQSRFQLYYLILLLSVLQLLVIPFDLLDLTQIQWQNHNFFF